MTAAELVTPECEWCDNEADMTVIWDCGHPSAMCSACFGPVDPEDPDPSALDVMDFDGPCVCPECCG